MSQRFPSSVFRHGSEPDARFSLANERTFLAWIRTALGLVLAAVAVQALTPSLSELWRTAAAGLFATAGLVASLRSWFGWAAAEKALRLGRPLKGFAIGVVVTAATALGIAALLLGWLLA